MKFLCSIIVGIAVVCCLFFFLIKINPNILSDKNNIPNLAYGSLLTIFAISGIVSRGGNVTVIKKISQFGIWIFLIIILVGGYGFRYQLKDFFNVAMMNLVPSKVTISQDGSIAVAKSSNGHFMLTANINDVPVYFLVDTGATDVALTLDDARRIGIDTTSLIYNKPTSTANGINYAASIIIPSIKIGDIEVSNVKGSILKSGLDTSLLGMSFLGSLSSYSVQNAVMVMEKK